jgi:hypothetical protein
VFFSGDTGLTAEYAHIRDRLGPFDLVMLEVGAFHPSWGDIHLGPDNALQAWQLLGGGPFLPIHWGTFSLAHACLGPAGRGAAGAAPALGVPLLMPRLGEAVEPAHALVARCRHARAHAADTRALVAAVVDTRRSSSGRGRIRRPAGPACRGTRPGRRR